MQYGLNNSSARELRESPEASAEAGGEERLRRVRPRRKRMSVRERVLDELYLTEPGNKATVELLMRGMPMPVTFGLPETDGTLASNAWGFVKLFHPAISICYVHPLCPFSSKERLVVFICSYVCVKSSYFDHVSLLFL